MRPILILGGIILALILGKLLLFPKADDAPGGQAKSGAAAKGGGGDVPVEVYLAKMEKMDNILYAPGTVVPNEEVELKAEMAGRLIKLNLREGATVTKGQLIAKINDNELQAQLAKLEYNAALNRNQEERQKKLLKIEAISQEEYEIAMNNVSTSQADKDLIMAQLKKLKSARRSAAPSA